MTNFFREFIKSEKFIVWQLGVVLLCIVFLFGGFLLVTMNALGNSVHENEAKNQLSEIQSQISMTDEILVDSIKQREIAQNTLDLIVHNINTLETKKAMLLIQKESLIVSLANTGYTKTTIIPTKIVHTTKPQLNEIINYAYQVGGIDFMLTLNAENPGRDPLRKSNPNPNGYSDFGLCQLHRKYHAPFIDSVDYLDPMKQVDYCWAVWQDAVAKGRLSTTFVAYEKRYSRGWMIKTQ